MSAPAEIDRISPVQSDSPEVAASESLESTSPRLFSYIDLINLPEVHVGNHTINWRESVKYRGLQADIKLYTVFPQAKIGYEVITEIGLSQDSLSQDWRITETPNALNVARISGTFPTFSNPTGEVVEYAAELPFAAKRKRPGKYRLADLAPTSVSDIANVEAVRFLGNLHSALFPVSEEVNGLAKITQFPGTAHAPTFFPQILEPTGD